MAISNRININRQQVLHDIGYCTDCMPSAQIESLIDEYIENIYHLIEPSYSYVVRGISLVQGSHVVIGGSVTFKSKVIARLLGQCQKVAVFLATIGNRLEEMVFHLAKDGLVLQAAVLDTIGSGVTETVADFVQDRIGEVARAEGLCISQRFSPGYCDWDIGQQKMVFRAMNDNSAGVRLTKECLMLPQKSVSGIIGIGPCNNVENYNPCETCDKYDCLGRR